jgi:imidazole glycerol-phosphate synthase subunit HisH
MVRIGILNMHMGNLRSISNAVAESGCDPVEVQGARALDGLSHLIVPGVGNYRAAMTFLNGSQLVEPIRSFAATGRPILGICLGMQILSSVGHEDGETAGLDLITGEVSLMPTASGLRLPHVGWNNVSLVADHPVLERIKKDRDFYFVHSYVYRRIDPSHVVAVTEYGESFPSIVAQRNVVGVQFHPEKSQMNGLALIESFCSWDGRC